MLSEATFNWIESHKADNPDSLRLKVHGDEELMKAVTQIDCRQRCRKKLARLLDGSPLFLFPSTIAAEQATSELLADWHSSLIEDGDRVLDLTCGLGIDAFTMAERASLVTAVEIDPVKADFARYNARVLGLGNIEIVNADSTEYINSASVANDSYDVVFIDPARRDSAGKRTFALADCTPDVVKMLPRLLHIAPKVIIKASPMLDVTQTAREIGRPCKIVIAGTPSECKELVIIVTRDMSDVSRDAVTLDAKKTTVCTDETSAYLYEPYPAEMKLGRFDELSQLHEVAKISPDTHLFTSSKLHADFPGNIYAILSESGMSKREIAAIRNVHPCINVATRGMGISADELRRRLGVKDGGNLKLFGVKDSAGNRRLLITRPLHHTPK